MSNLALSEIRLTHLVTHFVGNSSRDEGLKLSKAGSRIKKEALDHLLEYFLLPFKTEEFYGFSHPVDRKMNEVYGVVQKIFEDSSTFVKDSQDLANLLYEQSRHPKVKEGQFHVAKLEDAILDGEALEVIGIFKSETVAPFLKMLPGEKGYDIDTDQGFEIKGMDKGCLIFKTEEDKGYRILVHNANRSAEARYWNDDFLQLKERADEFHQTKEFMHITKEFVTKQMGEDFEVSKTDKIDLLNRSVEFFKERDSFDRKEFAETVLQDEKVIQSFDSFDDGYRKERSMKPAASFDISAQAVKKQARIFKSVLKLDKNFHVYIHGDKNLIERGQDTDGRKFYKIYFDKEE
jgi:hypothetical protein